MSGIAALWFGYEAIYLTHKKKQLSNLVTGKSLMRRLHIYGGYSVFALIGLQMVGGSLKYKSEVFDRYINQKYHRVR